MLRIFRCAPIGLISILLFSVWLGWSCGPVPGELDGTGQEQTATDGGSEATSSDSPTTGTDRPPSDNPSPTDIISDAGGKDGSGPDVIIKQEILTPKNFAPIGLEKTEWVLPGAVATETQLYFAIYAGLTTMFGGKTGLYEVEKNNITRVDKTPVVGLVAWKTSEVVVARTKQLYLWDGKTLAPTNFFKNLDGSNITALAGRNQDSFWIGTEQSLWMLEKDQLRQFANVKGVRALWSVPSKKMLVIADAQGKYHALEEKSGGVWVLRSFANENVSLSALTSLEDVKKIDFWGLDTNQELLLRKSLSGNEAAWWMFRLKPDKDDNETVKITQILFQQKPEHTWAITEGDFYRLSEDVARTLTRPKNLKAVKTANSTDDGALWLSDGTTLMRFGKAVAATGYKMEVEPIIQANCIRCHKPGGQASFRPFQTYQQVRDKAALILKRIDVDKNMPPGKPLAASQIAIFKSWIAGGYQP